MPMLKNIATILGNIVTALGGMMTLMDTLFDGFGVVYRLLWANWIAHFKNLEKISYFVKKIKFQLLSPFLMFVFIW
jgi:hypothetical protein